MKEKQVDYLARMLCPEYPEGCELCSLSNPEAECSCTIEEDCKKIVDYGFRMERYSCWTFDEYEDCLVCCNCYGKPLANPKALTDPDTPDIIILSDYCPHCGAKMNKKESCL